MRSLGACIKGLGRMTGPAKRCMLACVLLGVVRIAASLSFVWVCKELVDIVTGVSERGLYGCMAIMLGIMVRMAWGRTTRAIERQ